MGSGPILLALVPMIAWRLWAVFARLATDSILPETAMGISYAVGTLVAVTYIVATRKVPTAVVYDGLFYAALAGIASAAGGITLYAALARVTPRSSRPSAPSILSSRRLSRSSFWRNPCRRQIPQESSWPGSLSR